MSNGALLTSLLSRWLTLLLASLPSIAQAETVVEWSPRTPVAVLIQNVSRETPGVSLSQLIEVAAERWAAIAHVEPRVIESAEVQRCGAALQCRAQVAWDRGASWLLMAYVSADGDETAVRIKLIDVATARGLDDEAIDRVATSNSARLARGDEAAEWRRALDRRLEPWARAHPALEATASLVVVAPAAGLLWLGTERPPLRIDEAGALRIQGLPPGRWAVRGEAEGLEAWATAVDLETKTTHLIWPDVASAERRRDQLLFWGGLGAAGALAISAWTAAAISAASETPRTCVGAAGASCSLPVGGDEALRAHGGLTWTSVAMGATVATVAMLSAGLVRGEPELRAWELSAAVVLGATTGLVVWVGW